MADLTVGYIAGFIALAVFAVHIWLSTVLSFTLAGLLRDKETAATWTVAGRVLQSSSWPLLLRSDPSPSHHAVRPAILLFSIAVPFVGLLAAITAVVTPLGLYSAYESLGDQPGVFLYVADKGPFGVSTVPRQSNGFSRVCSLGHGAAMQPTPCPDPGNAANISISGNYTSAVPPTVKEIYSSGTRENQTTVSNYFDIEWRQFTMRRDKLIDNGTVFSVGIFRQVDSLVLNNDIKIIEGLIVDARSGGVGFRNHTIPADADTGATWTEDILFIEPVTACVDTNLTFEFTITTNLSISGNGIKDFTLVDRGGFANLSRKYSYDYHDDPQVDPDLRNRAYRAARLNNLYTMVFLNLTNPDELADENRNFTYLAKNLGRKFSLPSSAAAEFRSLGLSTQYGYYLFGNGLPSSDDPVFLNPFNITQTDNFSSIYSTCAGAGFTDVANISNIYIGCGLLRGSPRRVDGGPQSLFEDSSRWSSTLHSCAATVRATIKTVSFSVNSTDKTLARLVVTGITEKTYANDAELPLWGVESPELTMDGISPVWGLVSPKYQSYPNMSFVRSRSLHLLGYSGTLAQTLSSAPNAQNMPASDFPAAAMNTVFESGDGGGVSDRSWPFDLVGRASMSVFTRWQNLSQSAAGASTIVDLIWTDLAASAVVGTKGVLGQRNGGAMDEKSVVLIRSYSYRIKYYLIYSVPALILAIILIFGTLFAIGAAVFGWSSIAKLRLRLRQVSIGRVVTTLLYPRYSTFTASAKDWTSSNGDRSIDLGGISGTTLTGGGEGMAQLHRPIGESVGGESEAVSSPRRPSSATLLSPRSSIRPRSKLGEVSYALSKE